MSLPEDPLLVSKTMKKRILRNLTVMFFRMLLNEVNEIKLPEDASGRNSMNK